MEPKALPELRRMFRWALLKYWENNPGEILNPYDLKHNIDIMWDDMVANGEIQLQKD